MKKGVTHFTPHQIQWLTGLHHTTVENMAKRGELFGAAQKTVITKRKQWLIPKEAVDKLREKMRG